MLTLATQAKGAPKRISPARSITLRRDVEAWLIKEAERTHRSVSAILNQLAEKEMERRRQERSRASASARNTISAGRDRLTDFQQVIASLGDSMKDLRATV